MRAAVEFAIDTGDDLASRPPTALGGTAGFALSAALGLTSVVTHVLPAEITTFAMIGFFAVFGGASGALLTQWAQTRRADARRAVSLTLVEQTARDPDRPPQIRDRAQALLLQAHQENIRVISPAPERAGRDTARALADPDSSTLSQRSSGGK